MELGREAPRHELPPAHEVSLVHNDSDGLQCDNRAEPHNGLRGMRRRRNIRQSKGGRGNSGLRGDFGVDWRVEECVIMSEALGEESSAHDKDRDGR